VPAHGGDAFWVVCAEDAGGLDVKGGGVVTGEVRITKEQLKGLGKDFNSFVTKQMSGALSGEDESKSKNMKKGAKGKVQKK
jgi:hypothetical protein